MKTMAHTETDLYGIMEPQGMFFPGGNLKAAGYKCYLLGARDSENGVQGLYSTPSGEVPEK